MFRGFLAGLIMELVLASIRFLVVLPEKLDTACAGFE